MTNTNRPIVRIHDLATDEITDREMNDNEFAAYTTDQEKQAIIEAEAETKATDKAAILKRLGITADEAALLLA